MSEQTGSRFQTYPHMVRRFKNAGRVMGFNAKSKKALHAWQRKLRKKLKELTGYNTMKKAPLNARITEEAEHRGLIRQRGEIQTEPGLWMPFYILIPEGKGPFPAVICPHGHGNSGGKLATAGCTDIPEIAETVKNHNYDYGVQFAQAGMIAFCTDARGFGERLENHSTGGTYGKSCDFLARVSISLGQTLAGMWAWDLSRLIDYISAREDCIPGKIGCAGLSGGGLQTLWASALDRRIKAAVTSGYFYGVKESLLDMPCCWCNYVPHLWEYADMGDIAALIAPRPLLIETGDQDDLNGVSNLKNVKSQVSAARGSYKLAGSANNIKHIIFQGPHRWHGKTSIPWMKKQLTASS